MLPALLVALVSQSEPASLTQGVSEIVAPGSVPGPMVASGPNAFVVLTGRSGDDLVPLFVGALIGKGRVLAGGHEGFFGAASLDSPGNARFFLRSAIWLSGHSRSNLRVGYLDVPGVSDLLSRTGAAPVRLSRGSLGATLGGLDLLVMTQSSLDGDVASQAAVMDFVKSGHGLLIAGPAWGWLSLHGGRGLAGEHSGNRMLRPYGIAFADGTITGPFSPEGADDPLQKTDLALQALKSKNLSPTQMRTATRALERALSLVPSDGPSPDDRRLVDEIRAMAAGETSIPTPKTPVTAAMPFARLQAQLDAKSWPSLPPDQIRAHPSAISFPGDVPATAPRVQRSVVVDARVPEWHATGLYAAPGEVVTVGIPASMAGRGLAIRIGAHTDTLWHLDRWTRFPAVSQKTPLSVPTTRIASPFGGLIYLEIPHGLSDSSLSVTIGNAVPAPHYAPGSADWTASRHAPGPWADLEGKLVALTVPSTVVRDLANPKALMAYWDTVMEGAYELYAAPRRARPERYTVDRQISAGYMHSGYPIMTGDDVAQNFVDLDRLRAKGGPTWGFYHEMGHNFQQPAWTFDGTGEVTNNLLALFLSERLNGASPDDYSSAHRSLNPAREQEKLVKYLADGAPYERWKSDPFLALWMYVQLRRAFGWEPFTKVFRDYRLAARKDLPRTDEEKRSQWMVRFSRAVGRNLGPFFTAWGVPTSEAARKSIESLPAWMPADWPK